MHLSSRLPNVDRFARACLIVAACGATLLAQAPPPNEPAKPAAPATKGAGTLKLRYAPVFDAVKQKLPSEQWEIRENPLTPRDISKGLGEDATKDQKAVVAQMVDGEVMGGNNFFDKQVCMVMVLRFKDQESATKYMEMVHVLTRDRFDAMGKATPGATMEIVDEKLMALGTDASKRLVVKSTTGPRQGTTFINRFVKGPIFVEVTTISKAAEKSVDMMVTDETIVAVKGL